MGGRSGVEVPVFLGGNIIFGGSLQPIRCYGIYYFHFPLFQYKPGWKMCSCRRAMKLERHVLIAHKFRKDIT